MLPGGKETPTFLWGRAPHPRPLSEDFGGAGRGCGDRAGEPRPGCPFVAFLPRPVLVSFLLHPRSFEQQGPHERRPKRPPKGRTSGGPSPSPWSEPGLRQALGTSATEAGPRQQLALPRPGPTCVSARRGGPLPQGAWTASEPGRHALTHRCPAVPTGCQTAVSKHTVPCSSETGTRHRCSRDASGQGCAVLSAVSSWEFRGWARRFPAVDLGRGHAQAPVSSASDVFRALTWRAVETGAGAPGHPSSVLMFYSLFLSR